MSKRNTQTGPGGRRRKLDENIEFAQSCFQNGDMAQAQTLCRGVLKRNPFDPDAMDLLGVVIAARGDWRDGVKQIQNAISIDDSVAGYHNHLGILLKTMGQQDKAKEAYQRAIDLDRRSAESVYNLALLLRDMNDLSGALELNRRAVKIDGNNAKAHNNLGVTLQELGRFEEAAEAYRRAIKFDSSNIFSYGNLITSLAESDQADQALETYRQAAARWPGHPELCNAAANAHMRLNDLDNAMAALDQALTADPDFVQAHYARGMALLMQGQYEEGWREYEWRVKRSGYWPKRNYDHPRWEGEPLKGKTLLVHWDQGLGDNIQFARFLPRLGEYLAAHAEHAGAEVLFDCPALLMDLLGQLDGFDAIGDYGDTPPTFDYHVALMSIPGALELDMKTGLNGDPYLTSFPKSLVTVPRVDGVKNIGFVWSSEHSATFRRKICPIDILSEIFDVDDCAFYGLQFGDEAAELKVYENNDRVINLGGELGDMAHTGAVIAEMDLIISIDTYIVHLAGAMGKQTWVMLPFSPDWRWRLAVDQSDWYDCLRLFRPAEPGDWRGMVAEIKTELKIFAAA